MAEGSLGCCAHKSRASMSLSAASMAALDCFVTAPDSSSTPVAASPGAIQALFRRYSGSVYRHPLKATSFGRR
jgi:hypothetical protein